MSQHSDSNSVTDSVVETHDCAICKKEVPDDAASMICDLCELWFHIECIPMSVERYNLLNELGDEEEDIKWLCKSCRVGFKEMKQRINVLERRVIELESGMERKINDKITDIVEERLERDRRVKNLVFFGVKEAPDDVIGQDRAKHDVKLLKKLSSEINGLEIKENDIDSSFRVGKKTAGKVRPLCIRFVSTSVKARVLRNGKELRNSSEEWKKKVYIAPDLTRTQRTENKRLYEELKARRDKEEDVVIKNGKIVPRAPSDVPPPAGRPRRNVNNRNDAAAGPSQKRTEDTRQSTHRKKRAKPTKGGNE